MNERELVVDALLQAREAIKEHSENEIVIVQAIGVLNFLVDRVKEENNKAALTVAATDLMLYVMLEM